MRRYQICPECGAVHDLTGVDMGGLRLTPLPVHVRGKFEDQTEFGSMLFAESLNDPETCSCSEMLAYIHEETE